MWYIDFVDCDICKAPLNVSIHTYNQTTLIKLCTFTCVRPLDLSSNKRFYRYASTRKTRICLACRKNIDSITPASIMQREIGFRRDLTIYKSVSKEELHDWCQHVDRFLRCPDFDWKQLVNKKYTMTNVRLYCKGREYYLKESLTHDTNET